MLETQIHMDIYFDKYNYLEIMTFLGLLIYTSRRNPNSTSLPQMYHDWLYRDACLVILLFKWKLKVPVLMVVGSWFLKFLDGHHINR